MDWQMWAAVIGLATLIVAVGGIGIARERTVRTMGGRLPSILTGGR